MRVLVTRAAKDAERTAAALADLGHSALLAPVLEIRPGTAPLPTGRFEAALATSAHAVFGAGLERLHSRPLYAVGDATARAARLAGFKDVRTSRGDGRDLASLVALTLARPAGLLYLAGRDRKPATEDALTGAGYRVTTWVAYSAEATDQWSNDVKQELAAGGVEAALHYSRRSADLTLDMAERSGLRHPVLQLAHVCLSEDVASVLRAAAAARIRVAERPEEASLLALLRSQD